MVATARRLPSTLSFAERSEAARRGALTLTPAERSARTKRGWLKRKRANPNVGANNVWTNAPTFTPAWMTPQGQSAMRQIIGATPMDYALTPKTMDYLGAGGSAGHLGPPGNNASLPEVTAELRDAVAGDDNGDLVVDMAALLNGTGNDGFLASVATGLGSSQSDQDADAALMEMIDAAHAVQVPKFNEWRGSFPAQTNAKTAVLADALKALGGGGTDDGIGSLMADQVMNNDWGENPPLSDSALARQIGATAKFAFDRQLLTSYDLGEVNKALSAYSPGWEQRLIALDRPEENTSAVTVKGLSGPVTLTGNNAVTPGSDITIALTNADLAERREYIDALRHDPTWSSKGPNNTLNKYNAGSAAEKRIRDNQRRTLIDSIFAEAEARGVQRRPKGQRRATITAGPIGAGKSTTIAKLEQTNGPSLMVNVDDVTDRMISLGMVPTLPGLTPAEGGVHLAREEADALRYEILDRALSEGWDVTYDTPMTYLANAQQIIGQMKQNGYGDPTGVLVSIGTKKSVASADRRWISGVESYLRDPDSGDGGRYISANVPARNTSASGNYPSGSAENFGELARSGALGTVLVIDNEGDGTTADYPNTEIMNDAYLAANDAALQINLGMAQSAMANTSLSPEARMQERMIADAIIGEQKRRQHGTTTHPNANTPAPPPPPPPAPTSPAPQTQQLYSGALAAGLGPNYPVYANDIANDARFVALEDWDPEVGQQILNDLTGPGNQGFATATEADAYLDSWVMDTAIDAIANPAPLTPSPYPSSVGGKPAPYNGNQFAQNARAALGQVRTNPLIATTGAPTNSSGLAQPGYLSALNGPQWVFPYTINGQDIALDPRIQQMTQYQPTAGQATQMANHIIAINPNPTAADVDAYIDAFIATPKGGGRFNSGKAAVQALHPQGAASTPTTPSAPQRGPGTVGTNDVAGWLGKGALINDPSLMQQRAYGVDGPAAITSDQRWIGQSFGQTWHQQMMDDLLSPQWISPVTAEEADAYLDVWAAFDANYPNLAGSNTNQALGDKASHDALMAIAALRGSPQTTNPFGTLRAGAPAAPTPSATALSLSNYKVDPRYIGFSGLMSSRGNQVTKRLDTTIAKLGPGATSAQIDEILETFSQADIAKPINSLTPGQFNHWLYNTAKAAVTASTAHGGPQWQSTTGGTGGGPPRAGAIGINVPGAPSPPLSSTNNINPNTGRTYVQELAAAGGGGSGQLTAAAGPTAPLSVLSTLKADDRYTNLTQASRVHIAKDLGGGNGAVLTAAELDAYMDYIAANAKWDAKNNAWSSTPAARMRAKKAMAAVTLLPPVGTPSTATPPVGTTIPTHGLGPNTNLSAALGAKVGITRYDLLADARYQSFSTQDQLYIEQALIDAQGNGVQAYQADAFLDMLALASGYNAYGNAPGTVTAMNHAYASAQGAMSSAVAGGASVPGPQPPGQGALAQRVGAQLYITSADITNDPRYLGVNDAVQQQYMRDDMDDARWVNPPTAEEADLYLDAAYDAWTNPNGPNGSLTPRAAGLFAISSYRGQPSYTTGNTFSIPRPSSTPTPSPVSTYNLASIIAAGSGNSTINLASVQLAPEYTRFANTVSIGVIDTDLVGLENQGLLTPQVALDYLNEYWRQSNAGANLQQASAAAMQATSVGSLGAAAPSAPPAPAAPANISGLRNTWASDARAQTFGWGPTGATTFHSNNANKKIAAAISRLPVELGLSSQSDMDEATDIILSRYAKDWDDALAGGTPPDQMANIGRWMYVTRLNALADVQAQMNIPTSSLPAKTATALSSQYGITSARRVASQGLLARAGNPNAPVSVPGINAAPASKPGAAPAPAPQKGNLGPLASSYGATNLASLSEYVYDSRYAGMVANAQGIVDNAVARDALTNTELDIYLDEFAGALALGNTSFNQIDANAQAKALAGRVAPPKVKPSRGGPTPPAPSPGAPGAFPLPVNPVTALDDQTLASLQTMPAAVRNGSVDLNLQHSRRDQWIAGNRDRKAFADAVNRYQNHAGQSGMAGQAARASGGFEGIRHAAYNRIGKKYQGLSSATYNGSPSSQDDDDAEILMRAAAQAPLVPDRGQGNKMWRGLAMSPSAIAKMQVGDTVEEALGQYSLQEDVAKAYTSLRMPDQAMGVAGRTERVIFEVIDAHGISSSPLNYSGKTPNHVQSDEIIASGQYEIESITVEQQGQIDFDGAGNGLRPRRNSVPVTRVVLRQIARGYDLDAVGGPGLLNTLQRASAPAPGARPAPTATTAPLPAGSALTAAGAGAAVPGLGRSRRTITPFWMMNAAPAAPKTKVPGTAIGRVPRPTSSDATAYGTTITLPNTPPGPNVTNMANRRMPTRGPTPLITSIDALDQYFGYAGRPAPGSPEAIELGLQLNSLVALQPQGVANDIALISSILEIAPGAGNTDAELGMRGAMLNAATGGLNFDDTVTAGLNGARIVAESHINDLTHPPRRSSPFVDQDELDLVDKLKADSGLIAYVYGQRILNPSSASTAPNRDQARDIAMSWTDMAELYNVITPAQADNIRKALIAGPAKTKTAARGRGKNPSAQRFGGHSVPGLAIPAPAPNPPAPSAQVASGRTATAATLDPDYATPYAVSLGIPQGYDARSDIKNRIYWNNQNSIYRNFPAIIQMSRSSDPSDLAEAEAIVQAYADTAYDFFNQGKAPAPYGTFAPQLKGGQLRTATARAKKQALAARARVDAAKLKAKAAVGKTAPSPAAVAPPATPARARYAPLTDVKLPRPDTDPNHIRGSRYDFGDYIGFVRDDAVQAQIASGGWDDGDPPANFFGVPQYVRGQRYGDYAMQVLATAQGFTDLGDLVTEDEMDEYIASGELPIYRGASHSASAALRTGTVTYSSSAHGSGTAYGRGIYFASADPNTPGSDQGAFGEARSYAGRASNGSVTRATVRPDAKLARAADFARMTQIVNADTNLTSLEKRFLTSSQGILAMAFGYDAYFQSDQQVNGGSYSYLTFLNRGALRVQITDARKG